jgi:hypothetical protein
MATELDQSVIQAVANGNFKTNAEFMTQALAQVGAMQMQNAAAHQNRINVLAEAALAKMLKNATELDPEEAASIAKVEKSDIGKVLAELGATIAGIQQQLKGAQTTLPETGR